MSSLSEYGLSAAGLKIPRQQDFTTSLQAEWQAVFGQQVNLDPRSNNGQLINIMAERFALLAELLEAIYNASYPSGAEGVAVDNLLSLQGLTRLTASATKTAPSPVTLGNGVTLYGLVCYGTAGTVVPASSLLADNASPAHTFATDAAITIGAAQNAVQTLVYNATPASGAITLTLIAPSGASYTTPSIAYNANPRAVLLTWSGSNADPNDQYGQSTLALSGLGSILVTASSPIGALTGQALAQAINAKFSLTTVTGSGDSQNGILLDFGAMTTPTITATGNYPPKATPSIQGILNALADSAGTVLPFTDVAVSQSGTLTTLTFGGNAVVKGQPPTAANPIPLVQVASNTLLTGNTQVNATVAGSVAGQPAQGVGSATATSTGPSTVLAGSLTTIVTPVTGFDTCINQLDCISGTTAESDTEALARRASLLANQAQGPLAAILQRVREVDGVTAAVAFTNTTLTAQQILTVGQATSGTFTLVLSGQATAALPYNASAAQTQAALRALPAATGATVTGSATTGLVVDWGSSSGGQAIPLLVVTNNTTGAPVTTTFGRVPKSVEIVAEGGSNSDVAQAIYEAAPAGLATYGQTVLATTITTTAGSSVVTSLSTTGLLVGMGLQAQGVPPGALVTSIADNKVTLSAAALSSYSNTPAAYSFIQPVTDSPGNLQLINFSRPSVVRVFVKVDLVTDLRTSSGDSSSQLNPSSKFSPALIPQIQQDIADAIRLTSIGGTLSATGSGGIANAFRDVVGVLDASVAFDLVDPPKNNQRLVLLPQQVPSVNIGDVIVSFS